MADKTQIDDILSAGATKARAVAKQTLKEVKEVLGL